MGYEWKEKQMKDAIEGYNYKRTETEGIQKICW